VFRSKNDGFDDYLIHRTDKDLLEAYNARELVYLSPDAEETLETVESSKVYVIGGLSDGTVEKDVTLSFARQHDIPCKRLPIEEHMEKTGEGTASKVLTVNGAFEAVSLFVNNGGDWGQALSRVLPERSGWKVKT